jgi:eukaryotic-like serine/threonine-protein kinase
MSGPHAPRRIGDYLVHRLIGQGGMGEVFEAEEQLTRRRVAIKLLRPDLAQTPQGRRQFISEMSILASLDDPHVVRCLHCAEIDGQLVMVLEYLDGGTLRELLKARGALPWTEVAGIAWQVAAALRAAQAHRPPIVHRDLKPENVMCLPDGRVKVMDFGIAKLLETLARGTTQSLGTLQYMSPEQIDARPVDGRSDLFSLGLVMWELLVGRPPFWADSPRVLLDKLCTEPTPALPDVVRRGLPHGLESLIFRLLQKDPNGRPRDANEVIAALDALRFGQPTMAPAPAMAPAPVTGSGSLNLDTIAIVEQAARGSSAPSWLLPATIAGAVAIIAAVVVGVGIWMFVDTGRDAQPAASASNSAAATRAEDSTPDGAACGPHAAHWPGTWTLKTLATEATSARWIGGKGVYELTLAVDGCRLSGSGHKVIQGEKARDFEATGEIAADGTATVRYFVTGRKLAGTWTIGRDGIGTWQTNSGDSSGTLTVTKEAP